MASLEEFVLSRRSARKSAVCVSERGTTREGEDAPAYVRTFTFQCQNQQKFSIGETQSRYFRPNLE